MEYFFYYMLLTTNKICEDKGLQNIGKFGENKSFFFEKMNDSIFKERLGGL